MNRKLKCKKCKADNDYKLIIDPYDFVPHKYFECWFCKTRQKINAETGEDVIINTYNK
jgi:hypothetical protein